MFVLFVFKCLLLMMIIVHLKGADDHDGPIISFDNIYVAVFCLYSRVTSMLNK